MKISAKVINHKSENAVSLITGDNHHSLMIPAKPDGRGSSVNGGELLFLALATCYCNDLYREAKKRNIEVERVEVEVSGEFGSEGEPAKNISYHALVAANAPEEDIVALMQYTDSVAEIQSTVRRSTSVVLTHCEARELSL